MKINPSKTKTMIFNQSNTWKC